MIKQHTNKGGITPCVTQKQFKNNLGLKIIKFDCIKAQQK